MHLFHLTVTHSVDDIFYANLYDEEPHTRLNFTWNFSAIPLLRSLSALAS